MPLERPGAGLPLAAYFRPNADQKKDALPLGLFPSAVVNWQSNTPTVRERGMLWFMNHVTDKPEWWTKVFDEAIVAKWRKEIEELVAAQTEGQKKQDVEEDAADKAGEAEAVAAAAAHDAKTEAEEAARGEGAVNDDHDDDDANEDEDDNEDNDEDSEASNDGSDNENGKDDDDGNDNDNAEEEDDGGEDDASETRSDPWAGLLGSDFDEDEAVNDHLENKPYDHYFDFKTPPAKPTLPLSQGFTDVMFDFCIKELREKAAVYKADGVVSVFDSAAAVFKSDSAISVEVRDALREAVKPLEDVPEDQKDWHPGSDGKVLDLVHPSLWPLVYGKTRILADRELSLDNYMAAYGSGETLPVPEYIAKQHQWEKKLLSTKFQWLPAEVDVSGPAQFKSYINNLPYAQHKGLYGVIAKVIDASLPLWAAAYDRTMSWSAILEDPATDPDYQDAKERLNRTRIPALQLTYDCTTPDVCKAGEDPGCSAENRPGRPTDEEIEELEDEDEDIYEKVQDEDDKWFFETHPINNLNPVDYKFFGYDKYKKSGPWFSPYTSTSRIQVIVKLANIELTPEKPTYDGGSWHIEGQLNERICSTALYYYDNDNVTESQLAFRANGNAENMGMTFAYEQSKHAEFCRVYGVRDAEMSGNTFVHFGAVNTREGRLLVFPNVFQHQVQPFELADKTKRGHRKILALFLVDPKTPVISTANVPPQHKHYGNLGEVDTKLPPELSKMIYEDLACPYALHEAKKLRAELMEERKMLEEKTGNYMLQESFSLCEH